MLRLPRLGRSGRVTVMMAMLVVSHFSQVAFAQAPPVVPVADTVRAGFPIPSLGSLGFGGDKSKLGAGLASFPAFPGFSSLGAGGIANMFPALKSIPPFGSGMGGGKILGSIGISSPFVRTGDGTQQAVGNNNAVVKFEDLDKALQGNPAAAGITAASLLLTSSILLTVSPSLATASTSIGILGGVIDDLIAWSQFFNKADNIFLTLRDDIAGKRGLLAVDPAAATATTAATARSTAADRLKLFNGLKQANTFLGNLGKHYGIAGGKMSTAGPLANVIQNQFNALLQAQKVLFNVQKTPLGSALGVLPKV